MKQPQVKTIIACSKYIHDPTTDRKAKIFKVSPNTECWEDNDNSNFAFKLPTSFYYTECIAMRPCNINAFEKILQQISAVIRYYVTESAANQKNHCLQKKKSITIQKKVFFYLWNFFSFMNRKNRINFMYMLKETW